MSETFSGFDTAPVARVQAAFEEIAHRSMHDLSFLHPTMPVHVSDFTLFEGQWTGTVITPWMLSALIFPGPVACRRKRASGWRMTARGCCYLCR